MHSLPTEGRVSLSMSPPSIYLLSHEPRTGVTRGQPGHTSGSHPSHPIRGEYWVSVDQSEARWQLLVSLNAVIFPLWKVKLMLLGFQSASKYLIHSSESSSFASDHLHLIKTPPLPSSRTLSHNCEILSLCCEQNFDRNSINISQEACFCHSATIFHIFFIFSLHRNERADVSAEQPGASLQEPEGPLH